MPQTLEALRAKCGTHRVRVTQEIIERCEALSNSPDFIRVEHCVLAQALTESLGGKWLASRSDALDYSSARMLRIKKLPRVASDIVANFDHGNVVISPCEFDVEITLEGDD